MKAPNTKSQIGVAWRLLAVNQPDKCRTRPRPNSWNIDVARGKNFGLRASAPLG